jgi:hypothetical protein
MRGCLACALQTLRRHKGPDEELLERYEQAVTDVTKYLEQTRDRAKGARPARAA